MKHKPRVCGYFWNNTHIGNALSLKNTRRNRYEWNFKTVTYIRTIIFNNILRFSYSEQCHNLISRTYKTSCKTGEGVEEMFADIASQLVQSNRSKLELQSMEVHGFKISGSEEPTEDSCLCWWWNANVNFCVNFTKRIKTSIHCDSHCWRIIALLIPL